MLAPEILTAVNAALIAAGGNCHVQFLDALTIRIHKVARFSITLSASIILAELFAPLVLRFGSLASLPIKGSHKSGHTFSTIVLVSIENIFLVTIGDLSQVLGSLDAVIMGFGEMVDLDYQTPFTLDAILRAISVVLTVGNGVGGNSACHIISLLGRGLSNSHTLLTV